MGEYLHLKRSMDAYSRSEIFTVPLLHRCLRFEVAQVLEGESFIFAVQLVCALFTTLDNSIDIVVDE